MTYREFKSINDRMKNSGALSNYCRIKSVDVKNGICVIDMLGNSSAIKTQSTSISGLVNAVLRGSGYVTNPSILSNYNFDKVALKVRHKDYLKTKQEEKAKIAQESAKLRDDISSSKTFLLYHGSDGGLKCEISCTMNVGACDFGSGFYTGDNLNQAENRVSNKKDAYLYTYKFDVKDHSLYEFNDIVLWALYVGYNRRYIDTVPKKYLMKFKEINNYDIIVGYIADDKISYVFRDFLSGDITDMCLAECLKLVKYGKQYVFKTQSAVDGCLTQHSCYQLTTDMKKNSTSWGSTLKNDLDAKMNILRKKYRTVGKFIDDYI